jgi:hypothetical protein
LESSSDESNETSDKTSDEIQVDSSGNQKEPDIDVSEEQNSNSFKDDLAPGLPTPDETLELSSRAPLSPQSSPGETPSLSDQEEPPSPPIKPLNTSAKKKLNYIIVPTEEVKPKKNIDGNIEEQNIVKEKRIKI